MLEIHFFTMFYILKVIITVTLYGEGIQIKGSGIVISKIDTLYHMHYNNGDDDDMIHRDDNDNEHNRKKWLCV